MVVRQRWNLEAKVEGGRDQIVSCRRSACELFSNLLFGSPNRNNRLDEGDP